MEFRKFLSLNNLNKEVLLKSILIICLLSAKSEPFPYDNVRSNNWATPFQNWAKLGEKKYYYGSVLEHFFASQLNLNEMSEGIE